MRKFQRRRVILGRMDVFKTIPEWLEGVWGHSSRELGLSAIELLKIGIFRIGRSRLPNQLMPSSHHYRIHPDWNVYNWTSLFSKPFKHSHSKSRGLYICTFKSVEEWRQGGESVFGRLGDSPGADDCIVPPMHEAQTAPSHSPKSQLGWGQ